MEWSEIDWNNRILHLADQGVDFQIAETCLTLSVGNSTSQRYNRSDYLEIRREVMQMRGDFNRTVQEKFTQNRPIEPSYIIGISNLCPKCERAWFSTVECRTLDGNSIKSRCDFSGSETASNSLVHVNGKMKRQDLNSIMPQIPGLADAIAKGIQVDNDLDNHPGLSHALNHEVGV